MVAARKLRAVSKSDDIWLEAVRSHVSETLIVPSAFSLISILES
jgi:hypothetical protein